ncbi:MAG: endonuclease [Bacilli bacterium]|nr:endonuclease [Bacilli bacterium]
MSRKKKKKQTKLKVSLILIVIAIVIGVGLYSYIKYDDPLYFIRDFINADSSSSSSSSSGDITFGDPNYFSHTFIKDDFNKDGGTTSVINGLSFDYSKFDYLGASAKGVQIGSGSTPQKNLWTLTTTFPQEATIKGFDVVLSNNKGKTTTFEVSFGSFKYSDTSSNEDPTSYAKDDLNVLANSFKLSLTNTGGSYLKSVMIHFDNPPFKVGQDDTRRDPIVPGQNGISKTNYAVISKEEYYENIKFDNNSNLLSDITKLISNNKALTYGDAKTMLPYTDESLTDSGYMYGLYDGEEIPGYWEGGKLWQREHVWPCAKMNLTGEARPEESTKDHRSDLHNLRSCIGTTNNYRNDKYYDLNNTTDTFFPNYKCDENDDFRGDVARILFYMVTRYKDLSLVEVPSEKGTEMGKLSLLIKWHNEDPVDAFEIQRNNRIYEYQGNRNPYIDYPSLVTTLFVN